MTCVKKVENVRLLDLRTEIKHGYSSVFWCGHVPLFVCYHCMCIWHHLQNDWIQRHLWKQLVCGFTVCVCSLGWCVDWYMSTLVCCIFFFSSCLCGNAALNLHPLWQADRYNKSQVCNRNQFLSPANTLGEAIQANAKVIKRGSKAGNKIANVLKT